MSQSKDEALFDKRLIERNLRRGVITREQLDERLKQLPDSAEQADIMDLEQLHSSAAAARAAQTGAA